MNKLLTAVAAVVSCGVLTAGCTEELVASPSRPGTGTGAPAGTSQQPLLPSRPVVGGHLLVTKGGAHVVMADVEADRLRIFSASNTTLTRDVELPAKSWPTRMIEGPNGELYVLLRGLGEVATVQGGEVTARVAVCAEPRALALNPEGGLTVGCAGGELVRLDATGAITNTKQTGVEWRDVQVTATGVKGASFRAAEVVTVNNADLTVTSKLKTPAQSLNPLSTNPTQHSPQVAWRMIPAGTRTILVHQLHADELRVESQPTMPTGTVPSNPYGGASPPIPGQMIGCNSAAVVTAITVIDEAGTTPRPSTLRTNDVLPVDAAISPDGTQLAIVGAGGTGLSIYPLTSFTPSSTCAIPTAGLTGLALTSVAWISNTKVVVTESLQASPMLFDLATGRSSSFGNDPRRDSEAHSIFHFAPRGGAPLACASCHPEGGEDGHVWVIDGKSRRTQTLAGGVMSRAPFHWLGDLNDLSHLMGTTFVRRMGGTTLPTAQVAALGQWLDTIPAPKASRQLNDEQLKSGVNAFQKAQCQTCHLNDGRAEGGASDIGTGERVRAPSLLGLAARAPYLHTGQIPDIRTRVMGGLHPAHGHLEFLNETEREELIQYLEAL